MKNPSPAGPCYEQPADQEASTDQNVRTTWNRSSPVVDFRTILKETQNEQLNEANDQKIRAHNLIIEMDKDRIMQNLTNLKNHANFKGISVTEDYTVAE